MQDFDAIADYLISKIDIHVSGACGPERIQPADCFHPIHQAYTTAHSKKHAPIDQCMAAAIPGGVPRPVKSSAARDGCGLVYDRDIVTTWRLPDTMAAYHIFFWEKEFERALGRNTMLVVLEAFYDSQPDLPDECDAFDLIKTFRGFVEGLGTHMVSITVSSIVNDMMESWGRMKDNLAAVHSEPSPWEKAGLGHSIREFVLTRECWQYAQNQEPSLEVTFGVASPHRSLSRRRISEQIVLKFHYSYNLPTVGFHNLQNVVVESTDFILKPSMCLSRPYSELGQLEIEHYIGSAEQWLRWDKANSCFRGTIPNSIAPFLGVQRLDCYTVVLEITTRVLKQFPGGVRHENIIRCAMPLTVKRQPELCKDGYDATEKLPSPLRSMLPIIPRPESFNVRVQMVRDITMHSDVGEGPSDRPCEDQVCASQPASPRLSTPIRDMGTTKVNRRGELCSDSEDGSPDPTPRAVSIVLSPLKAMSDAEKEMSESLMESLSDCHRGCHRDSLGSPSFSRDRLVPTPPQKVRRPCLWNVDRLRASRPLAQDDASASTTRDLPLSTGRRGSGRALSEMLINVALGDHRDQRSRYDTIATPSINSARDEDQPESARGTPSRSKEVSDMTEDDVAAWQREIQRNYQESLDKASSSTEQAELWSDED